MVSRMDRNIVKEILRECYPRNLNPNENFVMYVVKLLLLDPNWDITENVLTSRSNVQKLVYHIINQLESKDSVEMMTLKMQFYFMWSTDNIDQVLSSHRSSLFRRLTPIRDQICITIPPSAETEMDVLKRLIVVYVVFLSGLGNPMKEEVFLEGLCALKSIMNDEEIKEFCEYPQEQKESQLEELSRVVSGIRLFNRYCDKGGAGIPNLTDMFKEAVKVVKEEMSIALIKILSKVNTLTNVFEKYYALRKSTKMYFLENVFPSHVDPEYVEQCKDMLIHFRQYELFIRKVMQCIDSLNEKVSEIEEELQVLLEHIFKVVSSRLSVPVVVIFPLFNQLSNLWTNLQHQVILLSRYSTIVSNLENYSKSMEFNQTFFDDLLRTKINDENRLRERTSVCLIPTSTIAIFLGEEDNGSDENIIDLDSIEYEYLGFCCWKLVETGGILFPGIPQIGVSYYNNKYYALSSAEAFTCFSKKPDEYVNHVLNLARRKPQLIHFLGLHESLSAMSDVKRLVEEKHFFKKTENKGIQSDDSYTIPANKTRHYKWNVWDLKREVLLMCNLTKCKTTSTQTVKSHSTNSIRTTTVISREQDTQTHVDKFTNVPAPSNFVFGLRGRKDDKQFVIDLTRSITK
ncbi:cilia- and flagella-associated protein 206-like [Diabrotica undecimpunctata]|uniref:cilia- and flagella-associated protein 206-like n=1 Tax=Diabrotica undecimpunctata TaxID=50387 RepID=UPI003B63B631